MATTAEDAVTIGEEVEEAAEEAREAATITIIIEVVEMDEVAPIDQDFLMIPTNITKNMAIEDTTQKSV